MDIKLLQSALKNKGYKITAVDGINGPETRAAVRLFQTKIGLEPDGIAGPKTIEALFPVNEAIIPSSNNLSDRAIEYALSQNGVREATGKNDGVEVEEYLRSVGLGKGYSWCMAFVYWCVKQAAVDLLVQVPIIKTGGVLKGWHEVDAKRKTKVPTVNSIFIMDLGHGAGHTGFVTKVGGGSLATIEGNTNTNGSANGNGVYIRSRKANTIKGYILL